MAERDLADSNKEGPIVALLESSAKESETTFSNEGVPGILAALNIRETAEYNSEVENEDCERPVVEDYVQKKLPIQPSSPNVSPTLPVGVASKAEKAASIARKAASSCRIIVEATTNAVDVGQKRISEALEKSVAATERSDIEDYARVAEVIEAAVVSTCKRSRDARAAAEEAEDAAKDAAQAAMILLNPVISNSVIFDTIMSANYAAKNATDKATAALQAEQAALKEMLKCYAETDDGGFSAISVDMNVRSANACSKLCDAKECAAKQFAGVCFIVGIMLMALVIRKSDYKLFWLLLCVALFMIVVPFLAMIYWIKTYLKERKASMEEKNKRVIREINDRLAELDKFFKPQD